MKTFNFFLICIYCISCNTNKIKALKYYDSAKQSDKIEDYNKSLIQIETAFKYDSTNLEINYLKAEILHDTKQFKFSNNILDVLISKKFKLDSIYFLKAMNFFNNAHELKFKDNSNTADTMEYKMAINYCDSVISYNNLYLNAYDLKIKVLHNLGKHKEALNIINNSILLFPDSFILILLRGAEKQMLHDNHGSLVDLDFVIKSNTLDKQDMSDAYRFRSIIYHALGKIDMAISNIDSAIIQDAKDYQLYMIRGDLYKEKGIKEKACSDYRKAADLGDLDMYETIKNYCEKQ